MTNTKGQSLVEVLVAMALAAILLPALLTAIVASREGRSQQRLRVEAVSYLREAQEAVRSVRDEGWSAFAVNGTYHPAVSGGSWTLAAGSESINGFTRQIIISDTYRSGLSGPIVDMSEPGAVVDPSTKTITTTVSWTQPYASSVSSTSYLTRHVENAAYIETTQADFNAGTLVGVTVRATTPPEVADDGEVLLGSGGYSDWCDPTLITAGTDLSGQGIAKGITAFEGKAYTGTGGNASGKSLIGININQDHPPVAVEEGDFDGYKTNSVYAEGDYAYIATDTNSKEVVIVRTSSLPYTEVGYFNAPGNGSGSSVYVSGDTGYVTVGSKLYNFDLSSKTGSRPIRDTDGVSLAGTATEVVVSGDYAYVSIWGVSTVKMQIVNISNPTNLTVVGQANVDGGNASDIYINTTATRAYLATQIHATKREMFIVDISTKTGSRPTLGSYEANGMDPKGVTVVPGNRAVLVGSNGEEYQVIDISNESVPVRCGGVDVNVRINAVASVVEADGDAYSYIVTQDSNAEFRIIEGGPGGAFSLSGTYESATFNPGFDTANNRLTPTFSEPSGTEIKFQVALAATVGGVCPSSGYTFVGPSGTEADYFEPDSGVSFTFPFTTYGTYTNPGQCLRYKVFFHSTDPAQSPVLYDITINYSP